MAFSLARNPRGSVFIGSDNRPRARLIFIVHSMRHSTMTADRSLLTTTIRWCADGLHHEKLRPHTGGGHSKNGHGKAEQQDRCFSPDQTAPLTFPKISPTLYTLCEPASNLASLNWRLYQPDTPTNLASLPTRVPIVHIKFHGGRNIRGKGHAYHNAYHSGLVSQEFRCSRHSKKTSSIPIRTSHCSSLPCPAQWNRPDRQSIQYLHQQKPPSLAPSQYFFKLPGGGGGN
jgi:hypothetical protein